jgi:hypothetical protein
MPHLTGLREFAFCTSACLQLKAFVRGFGRANGAAVSLAQGNALGTHPMYRVRAESAEGSPRPLGRNDKFVVDFFGTQGVALG